MSHIFKQTLLTFLGIGAYVVSAWACTPCAKTLDLAESIRQANVVIIGQRVDFQEAEKALWAKGQGPHSIRVTVRQVLKGNPKGQVLEVHSWDGMCSYGVVIDNKPHLLILTEGPDLYHAVNRGCAAKALAFNEGKIMTERGPVELAAFKKKYGL